MEADGIVRRQQYPEVPPRVEYSLSEIGLSLIPALDPIGTWVVKNFPQRLSFMQDKKDGE
jgi:DNA-binding HxlR family transcriptional regulator